MESFDRPPDDESSGYGDVPSGIEPEDINNAGITAPDTEGLNVAAGEQAAKPHFLDFREKFDGTQKPRSPEDIAYAHQAFGELVTACLDTLPTQDFVIPKDDGVVEHRRYFSYVGRLDGLDVKVSMYENIARDASNTTDTAVSLSVYEVYGGLYGVGDAAFYTTKDGEVRREDATYPSASETAAEQKALQEFIELRLEVLPLDDYLAEAEAELDEGIASILREDPNRDLEEQFGLNRQPVGLLEILALGELLQEFLAGTKERPA